MSTVVYRLGKPLPFADARNLLDEFAQKLGAFKRPPTLFGEFRKKTKALPAFAGLALCEVTIAGTMDPAADVHAIATAAAELARSGGKMQLFWHFQEKSTKQSKYASDMLFLTFEGPSVLLAYYPNGSRISVDQTYALSTMQALLEKTLLPMTVGIGRFGLEFKDSAGNVLRSPGNGFLLPLASTADPVGMALATLDVLASERFRQNWGAHLMTDAPGGARAFYERLREANLPAKQYDPCNVRFVLSSLDEAESLQAMCEPKWQFSLQVGRFDLGMLLLIASANGYDLEFWIAKESQSTVESQIGRTLVRS